MTLPTTIVAQKGRRKFHNPLPPEFVNQVRAEKLYICNVGDTLFLENRTYGVFMIKPADPDKGYSIIEISGTVATIDEGDERYTQQLLRAGPIAADLLEACNLAILTEDGKQSFAGVFISPTNPPSRRLIEEAQEHLLEFYQDQVAVADRLHSDPVDQKNINGLMRRAAKALKVKRPWLYDRSSVYVNCVACGEEIPNNVPICKTCRAIQPGMEELARKYFPERFANPNGAPSEFEQEQLATKPARPPVARRKNTTAPQE